MEKKQQRIFWAIFMATFFAMFGETIPMSFQPQFISSLGVSAAVLTLIYNIRNIIQTFLRLAAGTISDSLGKKNMMLFGLALFALVPFMYSVATDPWIPVAAMMASGLALSIYFPPSEALASEVFPPEKAGEAMGKFHLSWAVSSVIGPIVGGFIASQFSGYRPLFVISGVITCIGFFVAWRYTEDDRRDSCPMNPTEQARQIIKEFPTTMRRLLSNRKVLASSFAVFAHAFCHFGLFTFIPMLGAGRGYDEFIIGITLTANSLMIAVSLPIVGKLSDKVGRFLPIVVGLGVSVVAFALVPVASSLWMLPVLNAVLGVCAVLVFPVTQAATMEALPVEDRGSATGVWGMILSLGGSVGMFVMSGVLTVASIDWVFYISAAFTLVCTVIVVAMKSYFD
ncbi:MFS transporter [Candidatus Bathyarchaeota archaeon]|nr:MFS transporter [Candidatus Bathyarchaeota archaeon]MBT4320589.1 MFS transporter [Candidatus Bathyarchaeota archaeon]MBT4423539.1 MFS transporter [Candidatus Bathyarchaeota archaeon]MBT5643302.1 MFS transporter [Candidatus Bathyarchaeota archaeon]MBT7188462.1 MFS transporter [Candidatus Bathyarchaeota archaeon]